MIGVFDSGVGGLLSLREARRRLPRADFVYFGDTRNLPYGERAPWEILCLARRATAFLLSMGAEAVLAACGTADSLALPVLREENRVPLFGVLAPLAARVAAEYRVRGGRVALLATAATAQAGEAARALLRAGIPAEATEVLACPAFVTMAERGTVEGEAVAERVAAVLAPLQGKDIRTLALGCTHFSHLAPRIGAAFPSACVVDGAREAGAALGQALAGTPAAEGRGTWCAYTSGDPIAFARAAAGYLGEPIPTEPLPSRIR